MTPGPRPITALDAGELDARTELRAYLAGVVAAGVAPKAAESILSFADAMVAAREPLDAAWREAEAALPEYWRIRSLIETPGPKVGWEVVATHSRRFQLARGNSPAAALLALAAALRKPVPA